jgi:Cu/Ag efflux protein CusF
MEEIDMKRMFALTMVWAGLTVPLAATAESGGMMGGDRATPMMSGDRGAPSMPGPGAMASMSEGEVRKVDSAVGKLTLRHGPLENLDMPAMTMVFRVKDRAWLPQLNVGDRVRFVAERVDGNLTVTTLEPQRR